MWLFCILFVMYEDIELRIYNVSFLGIYSYFIIIILVIYIYIYFIEKPF